VGIKKLQCGSTWTPQELPRVNSGDDDKINWRQEYKYLGYIISSKLGWGKLIKETECKVRKRVALIRSFKLYGCSSPSLRKALFYSHVLPIFTWIYPIYPLLTRNQQDGLSKFYYTSLRRTLSSLMWNENLFAYFLDELSLEDRCSSYWNRYLITLSDSLDGSLNFEKVGWIRSFPLEDLEDQKDLLRISLFWKKL
jgi:hypothetical protein